MTWLFPFTEVEKGSRIVLYGAGAVGYQFYNQLRTLKYCEDVKWVDGQYEWYSYMGLPVESPASIIADETDVVVIAVEKESAYRSITEVLKSLGVSEEKLLWKESYCLKEDIYVCRDKNHCKEMERAVETNPATLLEANRMNVVVRYLYAKAFLENKNFDKARELYRKLIMAENNAEEPLTNSVYAYFSDYSQKKGLDDFEASCQKLLISMKENGFQKEHFIPVGADGVMINGTHRLAAALALGINVWTVKFDALQGNMFFFEYTCEWLRENGFGEEEIDLVQSTFKALIN